MHASSLMVKQLVCKEFFRAKNVSVFANDDQI